MSIVNLTEHDSPERDEVTFVARMAVLAPDEFRTVVYDLLDSLGISYEEKVKLISKFDDCVTVLTSEVRVAKSELVRPVDDAFLKTYVVDQLIGVMAEEIKKKAKDNF